MRGKRGLTGGMRVDREVEKIFTGKVKIAPGGSLVSIRKSKERDVLGPRGPGQ